MSDVKRRRLEALERSQAAAAIPPPPPPAPPAPPPPAARAPPARSRLGPKPLASHAAHLAPPPAPAAAEEDRAAYAPLPPPALSSGGGGAPLDAAGLRPPAAAADWLLQQLEALLRAHPRGSGDARAARAVLEAKLRHKHVQLENGGVARRAAARAAPPPAGRAAARRGAQALPPRLPFELLQPLQRLWLAHAAEATAGSPPGAPPGTALAGLDLHGAYARVLASATPQRCGLEGVVVRRSRRALALATPRGEVATLPLSDPGLILQLHGPAGALWEVAGAALPGAPPAAPPPRRGSRAARPNAPRSAA